jgi:hypothetical protein
MNISSNLGIELGKILACIVIFGVLNQVKTFALLFSVLMDLS